MKNILLVDGNSLAWASFYAQKVKPGEIPTGMTQQFLLSLRGYLDGQFGGYTPFILWDGNPSWRKRIYAGYKDNRDDTPEKRELRAAYKEQREELLEALGYLGVAGARHEDAEADDLARLMVNLLLGEPAGANDPRMIDAIMLLSGDNDWLQLLRPRVAWMDHRVGTVVGVWNFKEHTGLDSPRQIVEMKVLSGDDSDKIKGVGGIGKETAKALLQTYGSIEGFFGAYDAMGAPERKKLRKALRDLAEDALNRRGESMQRVLERNRWLIDLELGPELQGNLTMLGMTPDDTRFYSLCEMLGFNAILNDFNNWIQPFKRSNV